MSWNCTGESFNYSLLFSIAIGSVLQSFQAKIPHMSCLYDDILGVGVERVEGMGGVGRVGEQALQQLRNSKDYSKNLLS